MQVRPIRSDKKKGRGDRIKEIRKGLEELVIGSDKEDEGVDGGNRV